MPAMPDGCRDGILRGLYRFKRSESSGLTHRAQLLGSGSILGIVFGGDDDYRRVLVMVYIRIFFNTARPSSSRMIISRNIRSASFSLR